jgi:hypothetical protein
MVKGQGLKPDPRNSAVRHFRGASGNVAYGGKVNPLRNRKGEDGNPPSTGQRAWVLSRPDAGVRVADRVVLPLMDVQQNASGGKGPDR